MLDVNQINTLLNGHYNLVCYNNSFNSDVTVNACIISVYYLL